MKRSLAILLVAVTTPGQAFGDDTLPYSNSRTVWVGAISPANTVFDVNTDRGGNVYITGRFRGTVDFDPTQGLDERTVAVGTYDAYATKTNADGSYGWTYAVGGGGALVQRNWTPVSGLW